MVSCAISGADCVEPVVSRKSGHVFEKALILKHLEQMGGSCPITKQDLTPEDLLPLQVHSSVTPRPQTAASLPGMIKLFQSEWDALMLETFQLKKHLGEVREQLAHALYRNDAACRVIARLIQERDEARQALQDTRANMAAAIKATANGSPVASANAMEVDEEDDGEREVDKQRLQQAVAKMKAFCDTAKSTRGKLVKAKARAARTPDQIAAYSPSTDFTPPHNSRKPGINSLALLSAPLDAADPGPQNLILTGGVDGKAILFDWRTEKIVATLTGHSKPIHKAVFHPRFSTSGEEAQIFTASADKTCRIWTPSGRGEKWSTAARLEGFESGVVDLDVHPSGGYIAVAEENAVALFDVQKPEQPFYRHLLQGKQINVLAWHPDGLLLGFAHESLSKQKKTPSAAAAKEESFGISVLDLLELSIVAELTGHEARITQVAFSNNGYYAASGDEEGTVKLWDLRSLSVTHTFQQQRAEDGKRKRKSSSSSSGDGGVKSLRFSPSGRYLGIGYGNGDFQVFQSKKGNLVHRFSGEFQDSVTGIEFTEGTEFILASGGPKDRSVKVFSSKQE